MKTTLCFLVCALLLGGCTNAAKSYMNRTLKELRSKTISVDQISTVTTVTAQTSLSFEAAAGRSVVVIARKPSSSGTQSSSELPANERQEIETALIQNLLRKGYRSATRLNLSPVETEKLFPSGRLNVQDLRRYFKGQCLLILTVNHYSCGFGTRDVPGLLARANMTADLVDAVSSESLWVTSLNLDPTFISGMHDPLLVLHRVVDSIMDKMPSHSNPR